MTMLNFLIFIALCVIFAAGFWGGKTYGSFEKMVDSGKSKVKAWLA